MVEVAEQLLQAVFAQNGKCFTEMFVVQVRLVVSHASPDLPGFDLSSGGWKTVHAGRLRTIEGLPAWAKDSAVRRVQIGRLS